MAAAKTSWADDVDELEAPQKISDSIDENGIRTVVEYLINDEGKKVKVTRKTRRVLQKATVAPQIAQRQKWSKFGAEKNNKPGPDRATTTVGENVQLKLSIGNKASEVDTKEDDQVKKKLAASGAGKVTCRTCKGDHFTAKCPYKDTLGVLDTANAPPEEDGAGGEPSAAPPAPATGGKYVPPSQRLGARGAGEAMRGAGNNRDDLPTLRVTNVSEDTQENDLRELFTRFGRVVRVYIGRDRETGAGKGFAFISFEEKAHAQKAMEKIHGLGYDNLILNVQWSQPRTEGR
ncbi:translation initiation factor 3 RNA-binding subunit [Cylindrobasidium torrendii FP15055 ss-10]|uniref:Eukaryotic translation initiation factor 3 subunit G n=1 Tax=Cylindrobasidium torrendii FP15055 ss-10 TaxID=1314674 RepID=A0A0D7BAB7_9AGAR|nr:translation initiation factor 3 RNA-binding subunit [Cylindrobasidium torrendii FP15055 ss-10]